jgi:hypothetical protein
MTIQVPPRVDSITWHMGSLVSSTQFTRGLFPQAHLLTRKNMQSSYEGALGHDVM